MWPRRLGSVTVIAGAIHRRHNTSAILRSCEAFGVHEVHLVTGNFHASKGAARGAGRWIALHRWKTTDDAVQHLKDRGFSIWVADLADHARSPDTLPMDGPVAVLFGNELNGVSQRARELADGFVIVPMFGLTESLNVSVATACVLQRLSSRRREQIAPQPGDLAIEEQNAFFELWRERELMSHHGVKARVT